MYAESGDLNYSQHSPSCSSCKLSSLPSTLLLLPKSDHGPFKDNAQQPSEWSPAAPHSFQDNVQNFQLPCSTFILLSALVPYLYCSWYPWLHPTWVIGTMPSHSPAFIYILLWSQPPAQVPTAIPYPSFQSFSKCHFLQEAFLDSPDRSNLSIFWPHSTLSVPLLWHLRPCLV